MEVSRKVLRRAAELADAGQPFALCTVTATRGSVPGKVGAKMIVDRHGRPVRHRGRRRASKRRPRPWRSSASPRRSPPPRSSTWPISGRARWTAFAEARSRCWWNTWAQFLTSSSAAAATSASRWPGCCDQLEYVYSVLDDRAEFAGARALPPRPTACSWGGPRPSSPRPTSRGYSHIIILGYSHRIDTDILYHCCKRFTGYIGVISQQAQAQEMFARVRERGRDRRRAGAGGGAPRDRHRRRDPGRNCCFDHGRNHRPPQRRAALQHDASVPHPWRLAMAKKRKTASSQEATGRSSLSARRARAPNRRQPPG